MATTRPTNTLLAILLTGCLMPATASAQDTTGTTRLFFGPTGRTLPQGEGYVGAYQYMMPFVQVGVSDSVTLGAAVPLLPYLFARGMGARSPLPFVASAKARVFHRPKTSVAAGVIHFSSGWGGQAGYAYAVGTRERAAGSLSLGAGCAYAETDQGSGCRLVLTAGSDHRVSPRVTVITENHVLVGHGVMLMGGARVTRGRVSTDFAATMLVGPTLFPGAILNIAYRFGGQ